MIREECSNSHGAAPSVTSTQASNAASSEAGAASSSTLQAGAASSLPTSDTMVVVKTEPTDDVVLSMAGSDTAPTNAAQKRPADGVGAQPDTADEQPADQKRPRLESGSGDGPIVQSSAESAAPPPLATGPDTVDVGEEEFNEKTVIEYVNNNKNKYTEQFLDHVLELFFLDSLQGNIMELPAWKKKPPHALIREYLELSVDVGLAKLLTSAEMPEPWRSLKSLAPAIVPHSHIYDHHADPNASLAAALPAASTPITSRSSALPVQTTKIATGETPDSGLISSRPTLSQVPRMSRHQLPTSAKTSSPGGLSGLSPGAGGAAAYASRQHQTRQHSISTVYDSSIGSQEQIVERARQEAHVVQRIAELRKEGLWSTKRLPKCQEPPRSKAHWDYLLEEMQWLATDFAAERRWKKAAAKKCAKMITKYFQDKETQQKRIEREEKARLRKIASTLAKEVRNFWTNVEKVLDFKQQTLLEEKRKRALDLHLNLIVSQTEKYSSWLAEGLHQSSAVPSVAGTDENETVTSIQDSHLHSDGEFDPERDQHMETDDESTIAKEEAETGVGSVNEIDMLKRESEMPIEDLLPPEVREQLNAKGNPPKPPVDEGDKEFQAGSSEEEEDDEETLAKQEEFEKAEADYEAELKELDDEANLTVEQLMEKYKGAYADDFEMPPSETTIETEEEDDEETVDDETELDDNDETEEDETAADEGDGEESETEEIGIESLINAVETETKSPIKSASNEEQSPSKSGKAGPSREITDIAADAEQLRPKGNTLQTTKVVTKVPFLLKYELREYQHIGLDWLVAMYEKKINGILADEMGLGKTIQTIALLAHLACEKGIWGPHLIIVPTSVMLNWEMEVKKWCPAFKTLTYYGSPKERKRKREGWTKPNQFHICITSYKLVVQDHASFRRKKWKYLILDEAQHIKNFKSQRWQLLLNFNASRRLLLTGTPLQNNLMELWSLMHFLMPNIFASHKDFKDWFVNPVTGMIEGNHEFNEVLIRKLHGILRPFLLRRLKSQVEQQMPKKYEHVVLCRLSRRQRYLYEEFMSLTKTKETLATGNFLSVINVLMQLRKVCNHPNLFEPRPTTSPFAMERIIYETASPIPTALIKNPYQTVNFNTLNLRLTNEEKLSAFDHYRIQAFQTKRKLIEEIDSAPESPPPIPAGRIRLQIKTQTKTVDANQIAEHNRQAPPGRTLLSSTLSGASQTPAQGKHQRIFFVSKDSTSVAPEQRKVASPLAPEKSPEKSPVKISNGQPVSPDKRIPPGQSLLQLKPVEKLTPSEKSPFVINDLKAKIENERREKLKWLGQLNQFRCAPTPVYMVDLIEKANLQNLGRISFEKNSTEANFRIGQGYFDCLFTTKADPKKGLWYTTQPLTKAIKSPEERVAEMRNDLNRFVFAVPPVSAPRIKMHVSHPDPHEAHVEQLFEHELHQLISPKCDLFHPFVSNIRTQFPELRLIQYDCGKLQTLDTLLFQLKSENHRVLIFTQMSRMLDIFEQFLNYHGHTYLRLDGATKIEHRQALMERFNNDKRIFCFILSTRSGGVGVNLTGADTVIFYDSDWNPTMDAQAQDRCHRIGQTRDVHIYRLISERTIEENILKKAQQKRLLGDVAIEEGNFTTAFFKQNAITELFGEELKGTGHNLASLAETPAEPMEVSLMTPVPSPPPEAETNVSRMWEQALEDVEEKNDIAATKTARAEAAAELAEFDESIPLDQEGPGEEKTQAEEELDRVLLELSTLERYALNFLEVTQDPAQTEQLKLAEEEIEAHKKDWELDRLQMMRAEAEKASDDSDSDKAEELLTMSREDAYHQVYLSNNLEQMPIWAPPTPPQDDSDIYVDQTLGFLYENAVMPESQLPPVYVQKESKRMRVEPVLAGAAGQQKTAKQKVRKEEIVPIPRSLFDRPSPVMVKLRKEIKAQKLRGTIQAGGLDIAQMQRILQALGPNAQLPTPPTLVAQFQNSKSSQILLAGLQHENQARWTINEEFSIMLALLQMQELPGNLVVVSPGHTPNWDLVSDMISSTGPNFRSPRVSRHHYETVVMPREEGKIVGPNEPPPKKQKKNKNQQPPNQPGATPAPQPKGRPIKTTFLYKTDDNAQFTQLTNSRFETLKSISNKRAPTLKATFASGANRNNQKHIALLKDHGIAYEEALAPSEIALRRQERLAREKAKQQAAQEARQRLLLQQKQQRQQQAAHGVQGLNQGQLQQALAMNQQQTQQFPQMHVLQAGGARLQTVPPSPTVSGMIAQSPRGQSPGLVATSPIAASSQVDKTKVAELAKSLQQAGETFQQQKQTTTLPSMARVLTAPGSQPGTNIIATTQIPTTGQTAVFNVIGGSPQAAKLFTTVTTPKMGQAQIQQQQLIRQRQILPTQTIITPAQVAQQPGQTFRPAIAMNAQQAQQFQQMQLQAGARMQTIAQTAPNVTLMAQAPRGQTPIVVSGTPISSQAQSIDVTKISKTLAQSVETYAGQHQLKQATLAQPANITLMPQPPRGQSPIATTSLVSGSTSSQEKEAVSKLSQSLAQAAETFTANQKQKQQEIRAAPPTRLQLPPGSSVITSTQLTTAVPPTIYNVRGASQPPKVFTTVGSPRLNSQQVQQLQSQLARVSQRGTIVPGTQIHLTSANQLQQLGRPRQIIPQAIQQAAQQQLQNSNTQKIVIRIVPQTSQAATDGGSTSASTSQTIAIPQNIVSQSNNSSSTTTAAVAITTTTTTNSNQNQPSQ